MSIYVEILVRAPLDTLWAHTQTPALHERWDLRFSRIDYLQKLSDSDPQRFLYATRLGFGLEVQGYGHTTVARQLTDGSRCSALTFGSGDSLSIIREGSGYWKYVPTTEGIRFFTSYDYRTRFGSLGALFDRLIFRPLIGWATAWSFDRLRLWLEERVDPAQALRYMMVHVVARMALAVVFAYQGAVPKLLAMHGDELAMLRDAGLAAGTSRLVLQMLGVVELGLAAVLLVAWQERWPPLIVLSGMALATLAVGAQSPRFFEAAFNPFSLNLSVAALASIDLIVLKGVPSAARCLRRQILEKV